MPGFSFLKPCLRDKQRLPTILDKGVGLSVRSFWNRTRARSILALTAWCALFCAWWSSDGSGLQMLGLPLQAAIGMPVLLPLVVLIMVLFTYSQNRDELRSRDDG
jgi:hypothetical protein